MLLWSLKVIGQDQTKRRSTFGAGILAPYARVPQKSKRDFHHSRGLLGPVYLDIMANHPALVGAK